MFICAFRILEAMKSAGFLGKKRGSQSYFSIIAIALVLVIAGGVYFISLNPQDTGGEITQTDPTHVSDPVDEPSQIPSLSITVIGSDGNDVTVNEETIAEMDELSMDGGLLTSAGTIKGPYKYTGVRLFDVLDLVGGVSEENSLRVTAADGYAMVFTWEELNGDFTTYSVNTGDEVEATKDLIPIVSYMEDDDPLPDGHGPIRLVILGEEGLISEGHFWIKQVVKIEVLSAVKDYTIQLSGVLSEEMDRPTFESGCNCPDTPPEHQGVYEDVDGNIWTGMPIWLLVGRIDDEVTHTAYAYNRELADNNAYVVQVISADGYTVELNSSFVKMNQNIILANEMNGEQLPETYWPLRLVGNDLEKSQMARNIAEIRVVFEGMDSTPPSPPEVPTTPTTNPEADVPEFTLTLVGAMTEPMNKATFMTAVQCDVLQHVYSWTDADGNVWTGIPVWLLVGRVDDDNAHGPEAFNRELAATGYQVSFIAGDGYHKELDSAIISENNEIIIAYLVNGEPLPEDKSPLRVVGTDLTTGQMVSMLESIEIIFPE